MTLVDRPAFLILIYREVRGALVVGEVADIDGDGVAGHGEGDATGLLIDIGRLHVIAEGIDTVDRIPVHTGLGVGNGELEVAGTEIDGLFIDGRTDVVEEIDLYIGRLRHAVDGLCVQGQGSVLRDIGGPDRAGLLERKLCTIHRRGQRLQRHQGIDLDIDAGTLVILRVRFRRLDRRLLNHEEENQSVDDQVRKQIAEDEVQNTGLRFIFYELSTGVVAKRRTRGGSIVFRHNNLLFTEFGTGAAL